MSQIIPPLCFVLALMCLIGLFALLAFGVPEVPMSLQTAQLEGNQQLEDIEEARHRAAVRRHYLLLAALGVSGLLLAGAGIMAIRPQP